MVSCSSRIIIGGVVVCLSMCLLLMHSQSLGEWSSGVQGQIGMRDESKKRLFNLLKTLELEDSIDKLFSNGLDTFAKVESASDQDALRAGVKLPQWRFLRRKVLELKASQASKKEVSETDPPIVKIPSLPGEKYFILQPVPREEYTLPTRLPVTVTSPPVAKKSIPQAVQSPPVPPPTEGPPVRIKSKVIPDSASESQVQKHIESVSADVFATDPPPPPPPPPPPTPRPTQMLIKPAPLIGNKLVLLEAGSGQDSFTCSLDTEVYPDIATVQSPGIDIIRVDSKKKAAELDPDFALYVKEPVSAFARFLKGKPECLGLALTDPKKNPFDLYVELGEARSSCEAHHNVLTKILADAPLDEPATRDTFSLALQALSSVSSIFLSDQVDPSMHILSQKTPFTLHKFSVCQHHVNFPKKKLDHAVASAIEMENKYDTQVYLQASRLFDAKLNKLAVPYKEPNCMKVNTCWDSTAAQSDRVIVERENLPKILNCNISSTEMCTPVKGTNVLCLLKTCEFRK